jgi:hypothetical protein
LSYVLNFACDNNFLTCSITDYLTKYEGYATKRFNIDYVPIEKAKYHSFFRFKVPPQNFAIVVLMKIRSTTDNNMLKYFRLKICEVPEDVEQ